MRWCFLILPTVVSLLAAADDHSAVPPVVIRSDPMSGAQQIDPGRTQLEITFQQPLAAGEWRLATTPFGPVPQSTGRLRLAPDGRSVVVPVRLEPETQYVIGINLDDDDDQIRSRSGVAALPWLLTFTTGAASDEEELQVAELQAAEERAAAVLAELRAGDITAVYQRFDSGMREAISQQQLAQVWQQTSEGVGSWVGSGAASSERRGGYRVVELPLRWEGASWRMQISFDAEDQIAGLFITPPE